MTLHRVITRDDYFAELDEYEVAGQQLLFFHIRFLQFSAAALKQALKDWRVFRTVVTAPIYAYSADDSDKWKAFVSLFGFRPTESEIICNNGEKRRLYLSIVDGHFFNTSTNRPNDQQSVGTGTGQPSEHSVRNQRSAEQLSSGVEH